MLITDKEVELEFYLPHFEEKDIKVNVKKNSLGIKAEKKHESKTQKKDFYHHEHQCHSFHYETTLPAINPKKVKTSFHDGKLKIKMPKA